MKYDSYPSAAVADDLSVFEFVSKGRRGDIRKRIVFAPTSFRGLYSLSFGIITKENKLDYYSVTDNGDRNKILATVFKAVALYTKQYPARWIYFIGSTKERIRLYRRVISINLEELQLHFDIYAELEEEEKIVPFRKNMEINAFLIKRKTRS
ncbi:MAG TPA: hypothetical protein VK563_01065 [Puia sp.]|nr:hypothetical protein [Puia sp.]